MKPQSMDGHIILVPIQPVFALTS